MWKLYLDDLRTPNDNQFIIARSCQEAKNQCIRFGCFPNYISFDHDLGLDESGYDFAKWLVEMDLDTPGMIPKQFEFNVHSANPVGKQNIEQLLTSYLDYRTKYK